jgi:hypothetical protein
MDLQIGGYLGRSFWLSLPYHHDIRGQIPQKEAQPQIAIT